MPRAPPGGVRGATTARRPGHRFGPGAGGAVQGAELRKLPGTKSAEEGSGTRHHRDLPTARHSTPLVSIIKEVRQLQIRRGLVWVPGYAEQALKPSTIHLLN